ncbi:MAG: MotA/TolQ/ExbB proton channel family protein [Candidatus Methylacidiphilales bacterium]
MFEGLFSFFKSGGLFMIPIGLCSIVSLAFILERSFALRRSRIIPTALRDLALYHPAGEPTAQLTRAVERSDSTLGRLIRVCLEHLPWPKNENVEAVQTRARIELVGLERGLVVLEIITGIAPLLGLLGTVSGLITIFSNIGATGLGTQGLVIARGIAEALNTTVAGLVVAIPSLIAFTYFTKKVEAMMVEMESTCMDLLTKLYTEPDEASK